MKDNLVILLGPTGIGKTELSLDLAKALNGEIISSDSMQIYRYMDIGTAKIKKEEMENVKHHLLDIVDPDEDFTVEDYSNKAKFLIREINSRGKIPIVTGGTGLYINSLVYDLNFAKVAPNEKFRKEMEELIIKEGNEYLHNRLKKVDIESAIRLHPNDTRRVIRALEIYKETGKTMTAYNKDFRKPIMDYNLSMVGLNMDRQRLYDRINNRVDIMMEKGLLEEVKSILKLGYDADLVSLEGIGYKELIDYIYGRCDLNSAVELIKQKSRNYAKRQLTWFRKDKRITWFNKDDMDYNLLKENTILHIKQELDL